MKKHKNSYARELALQAIYQLEIGTRTLEEVSTFDWLSKSPEPKVREYTCHLIVGVQKHAEQAWEYLRQHSHKDISQISTVVRIILRLGLWELQQKKLDHAIIIDDLLELTRQYDGQETVTFVNGILDAFYHSK